MFSLLTDDGHERGQGVGPRVGWASYLGWSALVVAVIGTVILAVAPSPYVVERPGPVFDTLGQVEVEGQAVPLIEIPDETTYPTEGTLELLTVYIDGSREHPLAWIDVARSWFDPSRTVLPLDAVFPEGESEEEADEESSLAMAASQQAAIAAALDELGVGYTSVVEVAETVPDSPADGLLAAEDRVLAVNGTIVTTVSELRAELARNGAGVPATLLIERGGAQTTVVVTPIASETDGSPIVGVSASEVYDFPIEVRIQLERVGGPSAGMMFALGIYDKLTPGPLTGGERVAGTGTIAPDGAVGPIGGIVQKMYGAVDAGADWFLAPETNCADVAGHIPSGLKVFAVGNLDDAIASLEAIAAGDTAALATCER